MAKPPEITDYDAFAAVIREMLTNWASWQDNIHHPAPAVLPAKLPLWSGGSVSASKASRYDEAVYVEFVICSLSGHDQGVLTSYFIRHRNTVVCAQDRGMSRRKFEQWLNQAIGKFSIRVEDDYGGMRFAHEVARMLDMTL